MVPGSRSGQRNCVARFAGRQRQYAFTEDLTEAFDTRRRTFAPAQQIDRHHSAVAEPREAVAIERHGIEHARVPFGIEAIDQNEIETATRAREERIAVFNLDAETCRIVGKLEELP